MEGLIEVVSALKRRRLLVVGDVILDRYQWGKVERISPEAPIPVMKIEQLEEHPGGAGCVAVDAAALGGDVVVASVVGDDEEGRRLTRLFQEARIEAELVVEHSRPTTVKTRMVGYVQSAQRATQHIMRVDRETTRAINETTARTLLERIKSLLDECDIVLVSDYAKGLLSKPFLKELIDNCRRKGKMILVDPRRSEDYSLYHGATGITPNRYEAALSTGENCADFEGVNAAGRKLVNDLALDFCLITLDRDGIYIVRAEGEATHLATRARAVYDVSGAGDMVLATVGFVLANGFPLEIAAELANLTAGIEVTKVGAVPVHWDEVLAELSQKLVPAHKKIKTAKEMSQTLRRLKSDGKVIVFTNGCFDILHPGHVRLLEFAKEQGDILVVGLNSDRSVREIKGEGRPINDEKSRALMLAALAAVDFVVLFDEPTPQKIIETLRPDVLVKGEDWREKGVVGREFVESYGGRVVLAPLLKGYSTSSIIKKLELLEGKHGKEAEERRAGSD
ncbi:MAG: D-glycero-beta-D-manno-heptose 1-phosphate adenylyltransferase [Planctomycetota bacterium]|nr:MAG: D-glycero-beta-D-manno-heptose 1-phosphate adenylyltransferase [Planctomycetota bacterium]